MKILPVTAYRVRYLYETYKTLSITPDLVPLASLKAFISICHIIHFVLSSVSSRSYKANRYAV
jgi:hypothetical protein